MPADRATARVSEGPGRDRAPAPKRAAPSTRRTASPSGPPVLRLVPPAARREEGLDALLQSPGPGQPLPEALRRRLEASLRVDLSPVRVHADERANSLAGRLRARAFTFGRRIFLGKGELVTDLPLIAHEAAHVVQQRGRAVVQTTMPTPSPAALEREADRASVAVQRRETAAVIGQTEGPAIQRQERLGTIEDGPVKEEEDEGWIESRVWSMLGSAGQTLREIRRKGIVGWLLGHIKDGLRAVIDRLLEPIRPLMAAIAWVRTQFAAALDWMREAAVQIAKNDCSAVTKAVERIQEIANVILTAVKDKLEAATAKVKDFFTRLWDKFGAPIWETLKEIGGAVGEKIQQLGAWIWEKTQPVRDWLARAWTWVKNQLGIGESEEGQNGLLQWVQRKAGEAWDWLKPKIEPYKKPLTVAAGIALMFSPAGPFLAAGAGIAGFITAVRWIRQNMSSRNAVVDQRSVLERTILPAIMKATDRVSSALTSVAGELGKTLGGITAGLGDAVGSLAGSAVAFLTHAVQWIQAQVQSLATWAQEQFAVLSERVVSGLEKLKAFLQPVFGFLGQVAGVVRDVLTLPGVILGRLWQAIPACVRDPFVNFLIEHILKNIPLFKTITETIPAIWSQIKQTAMTVIRKIFKEGDIRGAALEVLRLVLSALGIPLELFTAIFEKGARLLDTIMEDPVKFLGNLLRALKEGVIGFGNRILTHLLGGLTDWLLSQLKDVNVKPPEDFSLKSVFFFVLDVLGLSFEMVLGRLEKKLPKEQFAAIKKTIRVLSEVWSWINTLLDEGPEGVWKRLKEKVGDLWKTLVQSASEWIVVQVAKQALAKLATLAAAPVGTIVQGLILIYQTLKALVQYIRQILELINSVLDMGLDLAAGSVEGAAKLVEQLLQKALGLALGFLAHYAGLGNLGKKIAEIIGTIREKVVQAVDWLIDKAIAAIKAVVKLVKTGAAKLAEWWKGKESFHDGAKEHTVGFTGEGPSAELVIESTPEILENYLTRTGVSGQKLKEIKDYAKKINDIKKAGDGNFGKTQGEKIQEYLLEIAKRLGKKLPDSQITFKTTPVPNFTGQVGQKMTANPLSLKSTKYAGSEPRQETDFWKDVNRRQYAYVRGHLLNHHVHGPGINENLVPIPTGTNSDMERKFESEVKDKVLSEAAVVSYTVEAVFKRPTGVRKHLTSEDYIPSEIVFSGELLDSDFKPYPTSKYLFKSAQVRFPVDLPDDNALGFTPEYVVLQTAKADKIATIEGIGPARAAAIIKYRDGKTTQLSSFDELKSPNIPYMPDEVIDNMKTNKYVSLYER
jgi:hypothetical protein